MSAPRTFSPLVMLSLVAVGVFAFAAFFTLSAFEPELNTGRNGRGHALSQSAIGFAAAARLAQARGDEVSIGRSPANEARLSSLVVLTPEMRISPEELEEVSGWATLIILPKWRAGPHPTRRGWVSSAGTIPTVYVAMLLTDILPEVTINRREGGQRASLRTGGGVISSGPIEQLQTIAGESLKPVIVDERGAIILAQAGGDETTPPFYILSDPDFLNTQGLANIDTARAGMAILDAVRVNDEPIIFDVTLNGLGASRSALRLAFEPPFLGATLVLALASLLLGWRAATRFGPAAPPRRAIAPGKAALAENSAALIRLARREKAMGPGYARLVATQVAQAFAGGARRDETELAAWLDQLAATHKVTPSFTSLSAEAASAQSRQQMLETARKLHAWKLEIERATR